LSSSTISSERSLGIAAATRSAIAIYASKPRLAAATRRQSDIAAGGDDSSINLEHILETASHDLK
jgi:hypothetical protein